MREPTNDEQRLMIIGRFATLQEYLQWMNEPEDPEVQAKLEEPNLVEEALEAMREEFGITDDEENDEQEFLEDEFDEQK